MLAALLALGLLGGSAKKPPVILVPGLTGSALDARLSDAPMPHWECETRTNGKWVNVWVSPEELLPREKDCLIAQLSLAYDARTDSYSNWPGVEIKAHSDMNLLYKYEFGTMIDHLTGLNYTLGTDLHIAAYDWRLAGDSHSKAANGVGGFYAELKTRIEQNTLQNGHKVVVLSHSLGCPTMLYFFHNYVSEAWRAAHIHGWVAVSGPWLGATMQANAYLGGWSLGMPTWLLPHDYVKAVQVNASSGVWLSPSPMAFGDAPVVTTPSRNYSAKDLRHLISTIGNAAGGKQALDLQKKLSNDLPSLMRPPSHVPVYNWYSTGIQTSERYEYSTEITSGFNDPPKKIYYGDGDGIVNHQSQKAVELFWPRNVAGTSFETKVFPNQDHFGMLSDQRVLEALDNVLNASGAAAVGDSITRNAVIV